MHYTSSLFFSGFVLVVGPCPLLRAYYPPPTIDTNSDTILSFTKDFTALFDELVQNSGSEDFGDITSNTTSFSVVLFSGTESGQDGPVFFEYHYTAPAVETAENVTIETLFPAGTLTQLLTVYAWLVEAGDAAWDTPITQFLPNLAIARPDFTNFDIGLSIPWENVTVGSLAAHMSGIPRDSNACTIVEPCNQQQFTKSMQLMSPWFLPDTTPIISNAAFQLLAFALESQIGQTFSEILTTQIFDPLNLTNTGLLSNDTISALFGENLSADMSGEAAAVSLYTTTRDLAIIGNAMLSSRLLSSGQTRRWLQPLADTSNLRNSVGRPWEIYHAGEYANSSILDVYMKSGVIGQYSSYFGLAPDFDVGFAILAHDTVVNPDLNAYVDIISLALAELEELAAQQMAAAYAGVFWGGVEGDKDSYYAVLNTTDEGPGLVVTDLQMNGTDLREAVASAAGIELDNLDFKLYPSNVHNGNKHQFVAVFQDRNAPVDAGTPTCITWMDADAARGTTDLTIPDLRVQLSKN
ncbi:beta-lactamase/transpeptidase-like protein [Xylariales sp. PMI_506]|nr:beta-lactamase/transpeptidase-like protein [Xylariales sp. PMI_506]